MQRSTSLSRRTMLASAAGAVAIGLAGCLGDDEDGDETDPTDSEDGNGENGDAESQADSFLSDNDAQGYEGDLDDQTGEDEVTVAVGTGDQGTAFDPAAIRVDSGTTVVWEWTGEGGAHNVIPDDESDIQDFGDEEQVDDPDHTVEDTFEESGAALYYCDPHAAQGMYGAVVIED